MKSPFRRRESQMRVPILLRFSLIIVVFLVIPTVFMALILDQRVKDSYRMRALETLRIGRDSLLADFDLEAQELKARAISLSSDQALVDTLVDRLGRTGSPDPELEILSRQVDITFTLYSPDLRHSMTLGRSYIEPEILKQAVSRLGPPNYRIFVDESGVYMAFMSPLKKQEAVAAYLVLQKRMSRSSIETLRLSIGQQVLIIDESTETQVFSTFSDAYGLDWGAGVKTSDAGFRNFTRMGSAKILGTQYFTLAFPLPDSLNGDLVGEIAVPGNWITPVDTTRIFAFVAIAIVLMVILASFLLTRSVISPIIMLSYSVEQMSSHLGKYDSLMTVPSRNNDEIGDLARTINELGREIKLSNERIEEQRAEIISYTHTLEERVQERTRQMEEARMRAEIANKHKSKFLVNMNHELRTPLNSIAGVTDLLRFGAYEKHEEVSASIEAIRTWYQEKGGRDTRLEEVLAAARDGLAVESNGTRLILQYIRDQLIASGHEEGSEPLSELDRAMSLVDEEERNTYKAYNTIRDAGDSLLNIIDEVINLSRIESGTIIVSPVRLRVSEMLTSCLVHAESYARSKRKSQALVFSRHMEPEVPEFVMVDAQKIKQVLLNLLTNAVKYTESGEIHIRVGLQSSQGHAMLLWAVQDTGRGIAPQDREFMFLEFGRAFEVREIEGTGLGLALSKRLVEKHGGQMDFSSEPGRGSTFWFTIPLVLPPEPGEA